MEKFEKILELLEKNSLTQVEKQLLEEFSDSDEELKSFISLYKTLSKTLSASGHISTDLLASYVLYDKGDDSENKIVAVLKEKIKAHLSICSACNDEYNFLLGEYSVIAKHVGQSVYSEKKSKVEENALIPISFIKRSSTFRYAFATLAVLIVSYVGLFFISTSITPDYKKNLFSETTDDAYLTRGRTSPLFQQGLNAIEEKDYSKAIEFLSQDINEHKNEKSIFYSHYILGLTYLRASESDFLGLFKSYNSKNVDLAITNLQEAIGKNNFGSYESLKLDAHYYLGRAYLLADNHDLAVSSLQKVIEEKGKFARDAQQLIKDLEKN